MSDLVCIARPGDSLPESYFQTRYEVLRQPLGRPPGSERLPDEGQALHVWVEREGTVVAVGRAHLVLGDGAAADHAGPDAPRIPSFAPLAEEGAERLRPAVQVRQMGVLEVHQGLGLGALVLDHLEREAVALWGAQTGWLQARKAAIGFYAGQGWSLTGPAYEIEGVGPHRSMWKAF